MDELESISGKCASVNIQLVALLEGNDSFLPVLPEPRRAAHALEFASAVSDIDLHHFYPEKLFDRFSNQELVGFPGHLEHVGVHGFNAPRCLFREERPAQDGLGIHAVDPFSFPRAGEVSGSSGPLEGSRARSSRARSSRARSIALSERESKASRVRSTVLELRTSKALKFLRVETRTPGMFRADKARF